MRGPSQIYGHDTEEWIYTEQAVFPQAQPQPSSLEKLKALMQEAQEIVGRQEVRQPAPKPKTAAPVFVARDVLEEILGLLTTLHDETQSRSVHEKTARLINLLEKGLR